MLTTETLYDKMLVLREDIGSGSSLKWKLEDLSLSMIH